MNFAYKVGHDAEFFVADDASQKIAPVCGRVGGTKEVPLKLPDSRVGTTVQEDGVALELGMDPVPFFDFRNSAQLCVEEAQAAMKAKGLTMMYTLGGAYKFTQAALKPHPQAFTIGCLPDRDAWQRGEARQPFPIESFGQHRFTGGHLHFSYECEGSGTSHKAANGTPTWAIVQMLDALCLFFYPNYDSGMQKERFGFYGLPGLYRNKPYGLEYRTPTNDVVLGGSSADAFVTSCALTVQACAELTTQDVRSYYDAIPWDDVRALLDLNAYRTYNIRRSVPSGILLREQLGEIYNDMQRQLGEPR